MKKEKKFHRGSVCTEFEHHNSVINHNPTSITNSSDLFFQYSIFYIFHMYHMHKVICIHLFKQAAVQNGSLLDLLKTPNLRKKTLILWLAWWVSFLAVFKFLDFQNFLNVFHTSAQSCYNHFSM